MAQALGLQVTLEGVETPFHLRVARAMGCDEVQGHLFGHAVPADGVKDLVERWPHRSWRG
jgi:EAL domain-containing protein (putative c-di-GMP-specific phosphodiesterase class I)